MNGFIKKYRWVIIIIAVGIAALLLITSRQAEEPVAIVVQEPEPVEVVEEAVVETIVEAEVVVETVVEPEIVVEETIEEEVVVVETVVEAEAEAPEPEVEITQTTEEDSAPAEPIIEESTEVVEEAPVAVAVIEEPAEEVLEVFVEEVAVVEPVIEVTEEPTPEAAPAETEALEVVEPVIEEVTTEPTEDTSAAEAVVEELIATITTENGNDASEEGIKPSFDVVRVDNAGSAVIAGSAEPYSKVVILSNGEEIGEAIAGGSGEVVAIIQVPENDQGQTLELESEVSGKLLFSDETILILPIMRSEAAEGVVEETAPPIIRATENEIVIIQGAQTLGIGQVSLDSISYDENDEVVLAGRGNPGRTVIIYVDETPLMDTVVSDSGSWKQALHGLDAGRYVLRVDEIDADGNVTSRVESPFQREYPEDVREAKAANNTTYTVQPGNSLWVIATGRYGDGLQYHQIFSANKDQIRDPDLIYPGQVFAMPE